MSGPLSGSELTSLRGPGTHRYRGYLAVVPQTVLATARINQTTFAQPLAQLTVDSPSAGWSSVTAGHTCWIGTTAGARDVGVFRVRAVPDSTTLYVQEISTGDFGLLPVTHLQALANDQYITIIADLNRWAVFPRIVYANGAGTFYKNYNVAYSHQNELGGAVPAICNIGSHRAGFTDADDELSQVFNASAWSLDGSTTGFSWNFGDGTPSSTSGTGPHTVVFPPGHRMINCTMSMSGGFGITVGRHVWAFDHTTYAPYAVTRASSHKNKQGRRMTMEVVGAVYNTTPIQHGAMVMYFEEPYYDDATTIASATTSFPGWVESVRLKGERDGIQTWEIEVVAALELMRSTILHAQQLTVATNPAHWQEMHGNLAHLDFVLYYLLYWHTTLPLLFDIQLSELGSYQANAWKTDRGNVTDELNRLGERLNVTVNQDSRGTLWLRRDPQMLETTALRNAVPERMTYTQDDISAISFQRNLLPTVGEVKANGLSVGTSAEGRFAVKAYAPGQVAGQGAGIEMLENQLVGGNGLTPQEQINLRSANKFANVNRAIGTITLTLVRSNYENLIEPAEAYWVRLNLPAGYSPDGSALNIRCVPLEVTVTYHEDGTKDATLTLEPETSGIAGPGQTIPVEVGNDKPLSEIQFPPYDPLTGLIQIPYTPFGTNLPVTGLEIDPLASAATEPTGFLVAWSQNAVAISRRPTQPGWLQWFEPSGETVQSALFNPRSPKLTSNQRSGALYLWVLTNAGLYYSTNALGSSPAVTLQSAIENYVLLRAVQGVNGGIAAYGLAVDLPASDYDVTFDAGGYVSYAGAADPGHATDGQGVGTGGNPGNCWRNVRSGFAYAWVEVDLGAEVTVQSVAADHAVWSAEPPSTHDFGIGFYDATHTPLTGGLGVTRGQNSWYTDTWTGSRAGCRYVRISQNGKQDARIDNIHITVTAGGATGVGVRYSADSGVTGTVITLGSGTPTSGGYDNDDFALGCHMGSNGAHLYFTTTYVGLATQMATVHAGSATINLVRIPHRVLNGTSVNNNPNALHFIYGMNGTDGSGRTLVRGVLNRAINSVTLTNITPVVSGVTYRPVGPESLETYAGDSRLMLLFAVPVGGGATVLLFRSSAGVWSLASTEMDGSFVRWKSSRAAYLAGPDGLRFTPNRGDSLQSLDGNYAGLIDDFPARGLIGAG